MRVVAVSAETSLAAALNMMDGWEVVFAREGEDVGEVVAGAAVVLAGGGTQHGLGVVSDLRAQGLDIPAVVLGDSVPPDDTDSTVLRPPFTLDELRAAVEGAVRAGRRAVEDAAAEAAAAAAAAAQAETAQKDARAKGPAQAVREPVEPPRAPEPVRADPPPQRPAPAAPPSQAEWMEEIEAPTVPAGNGAVSPVDDGSPTQASPTQTEALRPAVDGEERSVAAAPAPPPPPAEPAAALPEMTITEVPAAPRPAPPQEPDKSKKKKRRRDRDEAAEPVAASPRPASSGSVDSRLRLAEQAARAIEDVLTEMPFLADLEALSDAVVGEIVAAFSPEIVALYLPSGDGFWVAAGHQLTPAERRLSVKPDHPLFRELLKTKEPMLIAPLDLARAMVSGIAGARTEAMIAGPIHASEGCVGVIVVGRDDFEDKELDVLAGLAGEAASGLAVGLAIDRLRSRR